MKKEIISAILALTVVGGTFAIGAKVQPSTVVAQDSISELEQRQAELKQKSEQYEKELVKLLRQRSIRKLCLTELMLLVMKLL